MVDFACIATALLLAGVWQGRAGATRTDTAFEAIAHLLLFLTVWLLVAPRLGANPLSAGQNLKGTLRTLVEAWTLTWGVAGLVTVTVLQHPHLSIWLALGYGLGLLTLVRLGLMRTPLVAGSGRRRAVLVGASSSSRSLSRGRPARGEVDFVGFVPFDGEDATQLPHLRQLGTFDRLAPALAENECDLAVVCPTDHTVIGDVHRVFDMCDEAGIGIHYFPPFLELENLRVGVTATEDRLGDARQGLVVESAPNRPLAELLKRGVDLAGAAAGIIALLPAFVACALAVKLTSRGPIFFRQERVGKGGETFGCLKFRTMAVGAQAQQEKLRSASIQDGPALKIPNDPRITPVGRFLRKFSLDELPQLLNVVIGDMSLVGPRPPMPSEVVSYTWWQRRRISVKPGLTCVWQVWGRNKVSFKRWVEMDLYYIDNWSLWMDVKLIAHTVRVVLRGTGM